MSATREQTGSAGGAGALSASRVGPQLPGRVRLYLAAVRVLALALLVLLLRSYRAQSPLRDIGTALVLAVLIGVARSYAIQIGPKHKVHADTAALVAALLLLPAALAALTASAGCLASGIWLRRKPLDTSFNAAVLALATGLAALSLHLVAAFPLTSRPDVESSTRLLAELTVLGASVYYLLQGLLVHVAIGLQLGQNPLTRWLANQRKVLPQEIALILVGLFAALAAREQFWSLLLLTIPAYVVYRSLRDGVALRVQTRETIESLADIVDMRDHYTFEHSRRVAEVARDLARALGLSGDQVETVYLAARVHDVGKIGIKSQVLFKQGKLSDEDWLEMRSHPEIGARLTNKFPDFRGARDLILHHHERYDGGGYPQGLAGDRIPLGARIIAVADAYDAMTTHRAYRGPLPREAVLSELHKGRGTQFDPQILDTFLTLIAPPTLRAATQPATELPLQARA